jgi:hypothetical protein
MSESTPENQKPRGSLPGSETSSPSAIPPAPKWAIGGTSQPQQPSAVVQPQKANLRPLEWPLPSRAVGFNNRALLEAHEAFEFNVAVSQKFVGEVPGGFRIDLSYDPITDNPDLRLPKILSGNDWVSVSDEGLIDFDSRITIEFAKPIAKGGENVVVRVPVSARLRGRVSARDTKKRDGTLWFAENASASVVKSGWVQGFKDAYLPLTLTVLFDIPRQGFSPEETSLYDELRASVLGRGLFLGQGKAEFDGQPYGSARAIYLRLFALTGEVEQ